MSHIFDLLSKAIAITLLIFIVIMVMTSDKCTRVHRSSLPIAYTFRFINLVGDNWLTVGHKINLLEAQINSSLAVERFFEKTAYGITMNKEKEVYECNP